MRSSYNFHFQNMDKKAPSLPSVWDDDTRMSVLFAPFREKSLNPSSWEQKMNFWVQAILDESLKSGVCLVDAESLQKKFCRKGKVPLCLDIVLDEMHRYNCRTTITHFKNGLIQKLNFCPYKKVLQSQLTCKICLDQSVASWTIVTSEFHTVSESVNWIDLCETGLAKKKYVCSRFHLAAKKVGQIFSKIISFFMGGFLDLDSAQLN